MSKFDGERFGKNMRLRRVEKSISQTELADLAGLSIYTVQKYECGEMTPRTDKLLAICNALDCSPNDILNWC